MPKLSMPGAVIVGDAGGMVDTAALKGVHHCIKSGMLAAETIYAALKRGEQRFLRVLRGRDRGVLGRQRALRGAQHAAGLPEGLSRRQPACGPVDHVERQGSAGPAGVAPRRRRADVRRCNTKDRYPKPDGKYTFDKLSSVFITGNATRDDAPNHIRVQKHVPREIAETWKLDVPRGGLRDPR